MDNTADFYREKLDGSTFISGAGEKYEFLKETRVSKSKAEYNLLINRPYQDADIATWKIIEESDKVTMEINQIKYKLRHKNTVESYEIILRSENPHHRIILAPVKSDS